MTRIHQLSFLQRMLIWLGSLLIRLLCVTLRYRVIDEAGFFTDSGLRPLIMLIWHNRSLAMPVVFKRYYSKRKGLLVLSSVSRDGAYLSEMVGRFGIGSIRGSSSRRGAPALLDLFHALRQGYDLCITPDGPRGPCYKMSAGAILISQRCKAPLMPIHIEYSSCWRLKSWDAFMIPKPFSKVVVTLMSFIDLDPSDSEEAFEAQRLQVEQIMSERLRVR